MAKEEGRLAEAHEEMLRDAKKRYDARLALRRQAFGEFALFGPGGELSFAKDQPAPEMPNSVCIDAYDGLLGVGGEVAWSRYVVGGFPSPAGFGGKGVSYATVFAQVMLRLPSVALWLDRHAEMCRVGVRCLACGLRSSRGQLGRVAPAAVVFRARMAGALYKDMSCEHEVSRFFTDALEAMRVVEVQARRCGACDLAGDPVVTHVDRIFGFLVEERRQCKSCKC